MIDTLAVRPSIFVRLFGNREYYEALLKIALPVAFQNLIMSSLNMVSMIFIGQLGETSVAAIALANQVFFLLQLALFGLFSGSAMFTAQLWGRRNLVGIHKVLGLSLSLGVLVAALFTVIALVFPEQFLRIYSKDERVIALGAEFLRTFGPAYFFITVTFCFASVLRSTGQVRLPVLVSTGALVLNTLLSWVLIFGMAGIPKMGLQGAALAGLIARILECSTLISIIYLQKSPIAASPLQMFGFERSFVGRVLKSILPVTAQEVAWSLGITSFNAIYARIGTDAIAAMNIVGTIEQMGMVLVFALGMGSSVLVGNLIGAEEYAKAYQYAGWTLRLAIAMGLVVGGGLLVFSPLLLTLYKVNPQVIQYARAVLTILACLVWMRAANTILIVGILRSGGDTGFSFFMETGTMWCVGVPLAWMGAFIFGLPVYWVYVLAMMDELTKFIIGNWRYYSHRWIHNLAASV